LISPILPSMRTVPFIAAQTAGARLALLADRLFR
jgi:hypothetical protein